MSDLGRLSPKAALLWEVRQHQGWLAPAYQPQGMLIAMVGAMATVAAVCASLLGAALVLDVVVKIVAVIV